MIRSNRDADTTKTAESRVMEAGDNERTYRCHYRDVNILRRPSVQFIRAESIYDAVEQFVADRRQEGWQTEEIFIDSLVRIVDEETDIQYTLNKFGEPTFEKKASTG